MSKLTSLLSTAVLVIFLLAGPAQAKMINLNDGPFSAVGDGTTDDRAALALALSAAKPGDTVLIPPGSYRIILTKAALSIPDGVTLWGQSGKSKFLLSSAAGTGEYREFLRPGSDVTMEGLTIERDAAFSGVLFPIFGMVSNVTLQNCHINGSASRFPENYCHAIQVGVGTLKNLTLRGMVIEGCTYGFFQTNGSKGTVDGITVERSRFERNGASDLEFNAPMGTMSNVIVRDCFFRDNLCETAGGGFAVGFANVTNGRVENCHIQNYNSEALHVEDRSADIHLTGNMIVGGSMLQSHGVIMVLNGSKEVTIDHNFIDGRPNTNRPNLILVTSGGTQFAKSADISIADNVLVNGASTQTCYFEPGSGPAPSGNLIIAAKPPEKP